MGKYENNIIDKNKIEYDENKVLNEYQDEYKTIPEISNVLIQFDEPILYKDLKFYPVKMKFYVFFQLFSSCLTLRQDREPDIKVLQMKYLDYLCYQDKSKNIDNIIYAKYLMEVLLITLRLPRQIKLENGDFIDSIDFINDNNHWLIRILNNTYNNEDFLNIKNIICKQNLIELPDVGMNPALEKKYKEYKEFLERTGKVNTGDLGDIILCVMSEQKCTKEQVLETSIKTFYDLLQRIDYIMQYKINSVLRPYMKENTKLPEWTDKIKKISKLEEMSTSLQSITDKIKSA